MNVEEDKESAAAYQEQRVMLPVSSSIYLSGTLTRTVYIEAAKRC